MASKCSSLYDQSGLETSIPLSNALRFYALKSNPTFDSGRKLGPKTKYLRRKRTIGVCAFVVLPSNRHRRYFKTHCALLGTRNTIAPRAELHSGLSAWWVAVLAWLTNPGGRAGQGPCEVGASAKSIFRITRQFRSLRVRKQKT